ncbi:MAG TPA: phytanoyl-CoA dioxygenase family protein [Sediminibacterium sp.]|nr:phytanoyl-CoA dioxygenase family protein [Sediminibacterium sp.]
MNRAYAYILDGIISVENIVFYNNHGYLVAPGMVSVQEVNALKKELTMICKGERGIFKGFIPVEMGALDGTLTGRYNGLLFPHKMSRVFQNFLFHRKITATVTQLIGPDVKCIHSKLHIKRPGCKGHAWHQDEKNIPTRDTSLTGVWVALDDASVENGCLWVIPQRQESLLSTVPQHSPEYVESATIDVSAYEDQMIPIEVKAGTVLFYHGLTIHGSRPNKTMYCNRMALQCHYMSANAGLSWSAGDKLVPTADIRDCVMIAGEDSHQWQGRTPVDCPRFEPASALVPENDRKKTILLVK